jgi:hypothetical protein
MVIGKHWEATYKMKFEDMELAIHGQYGQGIVLRHDVDVVIDGWDNISPKNLTEAKHIGHSVNDFVKELQKRIGPQEYECDWMDPDDDETTTKQISADNLIFIHKGWGDPLPVVVFVIGDNFDYGDEEDHDKFFSRKGYRKEKDYEFASAYGDDIASSISISNEDMLHDEEIVNRILDFTGPNCYSVE